MATFAIGDLQGCVKEFELILEKMNFGADDRLWLLGDLVNRGPESEATLARVIAMGDRVTCVLGNHDLHFLAIHTGGHRPSSSDTFTELLASAKVDFYVDWLRQQKLVHADQDLGYAMAHAGIPHIWGVKKALRLGSEVEAVLKGQGEISYEQFCRELYGNVPDLWRNGLEGMSRYRLITNYFTRMRLIDEKGTLNFSHKGALTDAPEGWNPWFSFPRGSKDTPPTRILFGHWAALDGVTGLPDFIGLDTGCVWGRKLTGFCLETQEAYSVDALRTYS